MPSEISITTPQGGLYKSGSMLQKNSLLIHHGGGPGSKVNPDVVTGQLEKHENHPEQLGVVQKQ